MFPTITESDHQGLRVLSRPCAGPLTGTLHFGVGSRDEPVTQAGITHLVEHLVLRQLGPLTIQHNGQTDADTLSFWATGSSRDVAGFLRGVAASIARLDQLSSFDLDREQQVLAAELADGYHTIQESLLGYRFGVGLGLGHSSAPTMESLGKQEVIDWAQRWLTTGNATLTFTGALPDDLDVRVPRGSAPSRRSAPTPRTGTPALIGSAKSGVALSLMVEHHIGPFLSHALVYELTQKLRHDQGLIYDADGPLWRIDEQRSQCDLILDPPLDRVVRTAVSAVRVLRDLGERGFSASAVEAAAQQCRTGMAYVDQTAASHLDLLAADRLRGRSTLTLDDELDLAGSLTTDGLARALRSALPTLIVAVCDAADLEDDDLKRLDLPLDRFTGWVKTDDTPRPRGRVHRPRLLGPAPWSVRLTVDRERLIIAGGGEARMVELTGVVLAGRRPDGSIDLIDSRGRVAQLDTRDWRRSRRLLSEIVDHIGPERVRHFPAI